MVGAKPLYIRLNKIDEFVKVYGTRCLVLFGAEKYDFICNRIIYLIGVKSGITCAFSHNYARINVDTCDSSPPEKIFIFYFHTRDK